MLPLVRPVSPLLAKAERARPREAADGEAGEGGLALGVGGGGGGAAQAAAATRKAHRDAHTRLRHRVAAPVLQLDHRHRGERHAALRGGGRRRDEHSCVAAPAVSVMAALVTPVSPVPPKASV
ncbi:MAG: hypothetical protein IPK12_22965 [Gemmatimonadetes bacterium]|nr:hypothetical protein [Gemmatimonadota bacterium]